MDEMTPEEKEKLNTIINEEGYFPELADLPIWLGAFPPDIRSSKFPAFPMRDILLYSYVNWSHTKPWAWEGLRRLLRTLLERGEPIPEILQEWANAKASEKIEPPGQGRGRKENADRDARIMAILRAFRSKGHSLEKAKEVIADAINLSPEAVESVIKKVKTARPFGVKKKR